MILHLMGLFEYSMCLNLPCVQILFQFIILQALWTYSVAMIVFLIFLQNIATDMM